jgi:hypothetical protein
MTPARLRLAFALGALALVPNYGCGSVSLGTDGGADAGGGSGGGTVPGPGPTGEAGSTGGAGHGAAGATGAAGSGGASGATCSDLETEYGAALTAARSCTVGASGQCAQMVSGSLSVCFSNCQTFVNDATALDALKAQWMAEGCANQEHVACPAIACLQPTAGRCVAGDGGGGTCQSAPLGIETN